MKPWYRSKTLWVNLAALVLTWWLGRASFYVNPQIVIVGLVVVNLALRVMTTSRVSFRRMPDGQ